MIDERSLPLGWSLRFIPEVAFFQEGPGVRKSQYRENGIKLLNVANINNGEIDLNKTSRYISEEEANGRYNHFLVDDGDLLIGSSGISVERFEGKIAFASRQHLPLCMNTSTIRFKSLDNGLLDINFFHYYLGTWLFKKQLKRLITGSAQLNFGPSHLRKIKIPLPPLLEQKRIADILDKADAIRRKRKHVQRKVDQLLAPVFFEQFGDPVLNSQGRETITLSQYGNITTGNTPSRKDPNNYGDAIEWIKSDNINTPSHWLTHASEGLSYQGLSQARTVDVGATLVTCIAGSPECVGNAAITNRKVAFNQQINAITPANGVDPFFLYVLILLSKPLIQSASTQSMKGMVSKSKFEQVKVIFAPHAEQLTFNRIIQKIFNMTNKQRGLTCQVDDLFNSLVQRAFKGEL